MECIRSYAAVLLVSQEHVTMIFHHTTLGMVTSFQIMGEGEGWFMIAWYFVFQMDSSRYN